MNIIIGLIQDTWVYFVSNRGILPEMHGQNILLEIDVRGIPKRIIHRDFQSLYSDKDIRTVKNFLNLINMLLVLRKISRNISNTALFLIISFQNIFWRGW